MKIFKFLKGLYGALEKEEETTKILVPPIYEDVYISKNEFFEKLPESKCDLINGTFYEKQKLQLTDKLIEILSNSNKSLHYRQIYNIVVNEFDNTKDMYSVKATLYYLSRKKKIRNGKKPGTFKAIRKSQKK